MGGSHLVKEAILADELLSSLGVDSDGEPHMCNQELGGGATENVREVQTCACVSPGPQEPSTTPSGPLWRVMLGLREEMQVGMKVFTAQ